ncbi:mitochondrial inner membrane protease [Planoprotostelium fungivorum]|uniref:Mitochondrial inner membrane protease ATP23 n=1 Tax=Planoprotostelium fungivorum TaxID=1890364 RepID=A0A2P6NR37_9EUKA|nr:mitochondrial inner membrane protease [Planoprotostelium fungivorum]
MSSKEAENHAKCETSLKTSITDQRVHTILDAISRSGCYIPPDFVKCAPCNTNATAAVFSNQKGVTICENNIFGRRDLVDRAVAHELIHAFDYCRANMQMSNCAHLACSEIRAANLSGDCHYSVEIQRHPLNIFKLKNQHNECVRRRAILSLKSNPLCGEDAEQAVDSVWRSCVNDYSPFGYIP